MRERGMNLIKGIALLLFASFLAEKLITGKIYNYISPRFSWTTIVAILIFLVMAFFYILANPEHDEHGAEPTHDHVHEHKLSKGSLLFGGLLLIFGLVIPVRPLGVSQVTNQGISTDVSAPNVDLQSSLTIVPAERNILDWVRAIGANPDPAALTGQSADVIGFVYRDVRFSGDKFMVARFTVSCCVADARALGLVVEMADSSQFSTGAWVRVAGIFNEGDLDNLPIPVIQAQKITLVEQPLQPYLYP
jgi:putative membrane protein